MARLCTQVGSIFMMWGVWSSEKGRIARSAASSGRVFFFRRYWFELRAPDLPGKPFRLVYYNNEDPGPAVEPVGTILLEPQNFTVRDTRQPRPTRPHCCRIDGRVYGKHFKYVVSCADVAEDARWRRALQTLHGASADTSAVEWATGWMELEATAGAKVKGLGSAVKAEAEVQMMSQAAKIGAAEDESSTLWVGSIPDSHVSEGFLHSVLAAHGTIVKITLRSKVAGMGGDFDEAAAALPNRSWAFVTFSEARAVDSAIATGAKVVGRSSMSHRAAAAAAGAAGEGEGEGERGLDSSKVRLQELKGGQGGRTVDKELHEHGLRLRRANVEEQLRLKQGTGAEGALESKVRACSLAVAPGNSMWGMGWGGGRESRQAGRRVGELS
jgi:hypothetical protein|eukprot:COSAG01_NODE_6026_length_3894_cov_5.798419_2_plen_384_part_00